MSRSQKHKNDSQVVSYFKIYGHEHVKAARKMLMKLTPDKRYTEGEDSGDHGIYTNSLKMKKFLFFLK